MKNVHVLLTLLLSSSLLLSQHTNAQSIPTVTEVTSFLNNNHFLVTYREGEVMYGTYYFMDVHYCPSGYYTLYGKTEKKTVLGNDQVSNWQEAGSWKVLKVKESIGVMYKTTTGVDKFFPVSRSSDGKLSFGQGLSVVRQGSAVCK